MKAPMNWIREYTDIPADAAVYTDRMVLTGTGVEGYEALGAEIHNVVTGRVLSLERHPDSDHLWVCQIDVGGERPLQIVTGAQNLHGGEIVPVCLDGAKLPGGKEIKTGKLRGVLSEGMLCGGSELGVDDSLYPGAGVNGIMIFHEELPLGVDVRPLIGKDDTVVDFDILANRPDCQCIWGLARESAAAFNTAFKKPEITFKAHSGSIENEAKVEVLDHDLCPRYACRVVKNVRVAPSPMWLRAYLHAAGMRSINNVVDITNFVMLETGHPMHAFDLAKVHGRHIIVRRAAEGEPLRTLDGKEYSLGSSMLVIADEQGPTGLAGIMGGEESEITEETKEILFECAAFDRANIRVTARTLGIRTEASGRFEKGVCPATVMEALDRACQLVDQLDAGDVVGDTIDLYPDPLPEKTVTASLSRIRRWTGVDIPDEEIASILRRLHFGVTIDGDTITAEVPEFRQDVDGFADLAEEALRYYGFEHLSSTRLHGEVPRGGRNEDMKLADKIKAMLIGMGGHEIMTFSFIARSAIEKLGLPADDGRLDPVVIRNPLGEDTAVMRTSMVPGIMSVLATNFNRQNDGSLLYELGRVFIGHGRKPGELPVEIPTAALAAFGPGWDFYRIRGCVEEILRVLGVEYKLEAGADAYYHPGRSVRLIAKDGRVIAQLGEAHPSMLEAFDCPAHACLSEIDLAALKALETPAGAIKPLPRFPAVDRDVALVMDESQPVGPVLAAIRRAGGQLMEKAEMFDVYRDARLGANKKSVAFSMRFRSADHTLTDEEISKAFDKVVRGCEHQFHAEIRK